MWLTFIYCIRCYQTVHTSVSLHLTYCLQVSNWGSARSPTSQPEGLETALTWWRRCHVMSPVVTTGSCSAWISVFPMTRSRAAWAVSCRKSSVSTVAVRACCRDSVCWSPAPSSREWAVPLTRLSFHWNTGQTFYEEILIFTLTSPLTLWLQLNCSTWGVFHDWTPFTNFFSWLLSLPPVKPLLL